MNLSFKAKLLALCGFLASVSLVIATLSYRGLHQVEEGYDEVTHIAMPSLNALNDMFLHYRSIRINLRSLGLPGLSVAQAESYVQGTKQAIAAYEATDKAYQELPFLPGQKEKYEKLNQAWIHFKQIGIRALELQSKGASSSAELNKIFLEDCVDAAKNYGEAVAVLEEFHKEQAQLEIAEAEETGKKTNRMVMGISLIGTLLGLAVGFLFSQSITNGIQSVTQQLESNADQVAAASSQIASSSQMLSQATTEQAASLEQTAASLEEITSMIVKATENAQLTSETSSESQKKAEQGRAAVDQMLLSMDEISQSNEAILNQINESNRQMVEIVKVIQDIGSRTKVINEIVFQTKLLSFNASVEAARAGEHGKGFAVVAEEVGNLAQMSGNAAKEITDMLEVSIAKVENIAQETRQKVEILIQNAKDRVSGGVNVAKDCSQVLNEIVQNVSRVSALSQEISQASKEQSQGVSEISKAMAQLDTTTQQNSAASEEAASSAEELSGQAQSLKARVDELTGIINGSQGSRKNEPLADSLEHQGLKLGKIVTHGVYNKQAS